MIAVASGSIRPAPAGAEEAGSGCWYLVKAAEREATRRVRETCKCHDAQGLQERASSTIMMGYVAKVLVRVKRVLTHLVLGFHPAWSVGPSSSMCCTRNRSLQFVNLLEKWKGELFAMAEASISVLLRR